MIAFSVFHQHLPYDNIIIADGLGINDRPYAMPEVLPWRRRYILRVGNGYYGMSQRDEDQALLIHELTHVWQGHHSAWAWGYVANSAWHQVSGDAYKYDPNAFKQWEDYNVEQQASIVEDWFSSGMKEDDPRFQFIFYKIRFG